VAPVIKACRDTTVVIGRLRDVAFQAAHW
jgi:hypothetical protein